MPPEREVFLRDAIDVHVHTAPDLIDRYETDLALARDARAHGMRGIVVKSHVMPTVARAALVNEAVGEDVLYGGVALNGAVGGLNPDAVETALSLGARIVWLPTGWSANHARAERAAGRDRFVGQRVPGPDEAIRVAEGGSVTAETDRIIDLVAASDAALATGHASLDEIRQVVGACADAGVRCLVNHPFFRHATLSIDTQVSLADRGAVMEYCAFSTTNTPGHDVAAVAEAIERVGPDNAVLATDYGQAGNPPIEGLVEFASAVHEAGIAEADVRLMLTETPARVLGLSLPR